MLVPHSSTNTQTLRDPCSSPHLAKHFSLLRFVRRHPNSFFERPSQPADRPRHSGDRDLNPLLSLPELTVFLQSSVIVLFELLSHKAFLCSTLWPIEKGRLGGGLGATDPVSLLNLR